MQARYRAMTEQKMFLNEQLKTVMKMNGVLKVTRSLSPD